MYPSSLHFGHIAMSLYGVMAAAGLVLGLGMSVRTARLAGLDPDAVWDAGMFGVVAAFVISRCLLMAEHFRQFLHSPVLLLGTPALDRAGVTATGLATVIWLVRHRLPVPRMMDVWAPCATLIWGFLGVGHFFEGSDRGVGRGSVGLYVTVWGWGLTGLLVQMLRVGRVGRTVGVGLIGAGLGEFLLGFVRVPDMSGVTTLLDVWQWVGIGMMVVGCLVVGVVGGWVGVLRSGLDSGC